MAPALIKFCLCLSNSLLGITDWGSSHTAPDSDDLSASGIAGNRVMSAKIWNDTDPEPADFTHRGLDFFDDVSMFNGSYSSLISKPDGQQDDSFPVSVSINSVLSPDGTSVDTANVSIEDNQGDTLSVGKNLGANLDEVQWLASNNDSTKWPNDPDALSALWRFVLRRNWRQGYLTFSWGYVPPKESPSGPTKAKLTARFNGSVWLSDMNASVQVDGNILPDSVLALLIAHQASATADRFLGPLISTRPSPLLLAQSLLPLTSNAQSAGLFFLIGISIYKAFKKFNEWRKNRKKVDDKINSGEEPGAVEMIELESSNQSLENNRPIAEVNERTPLIDRLDPRTFPKAVDQNGEPRRSYRGEGVLQGQATEEACAKMTKTGRIFVAFYRHRKRVDLLRELNCYNCPTQYGKWRKSEGFGKLWTAL
ncbi:hypothetical protein C8J57DRAFT_1264856 [Mycena rebaudengoi]|nr:hypothetical protein C8J57DRAFT_1264856 [Mycena rebaudengoi]